MYIVVSNLGKKLKTLGKVLVFLLALGVLIPEQLPCNNYAPAVSTWLQEKSQEEDRCAPNPCRKPGLIR